MKEPSDAKLTNASNSGVVALAALVLLSGCTKNAPVRPGEEAAAATGACWHLIFQCTEVPGNPGGGAPSFHTWFSVSQSGSYSLRHSVRSLTGELTSDVYHAGALTPRQLGVLGDAIAAADLPSMGSDLVELAGGSGIEDGWAGSVTFAAPGKTTLIHFNSRGGFPTDPVARDRVERFSRLVYQTRALISGTVRSMESK